MFDHSFDCIVGLAYPKMAARFKQSGERHVPFFDSLIEQKILHDNIFAFSMARHDREPASKLTFGWVDRKAFQGELAWHPVVLPVFWSLALDKVTLSLQNDATGHKIVILELCSQKGAVACIVTPDSGTSTLTFPSWAFDELEHALSSTGADPRHACPPSFKLLTLT